MKYRVNHLIFILVIITVAPSALSQSPVSRISLGPNDIGIVKTAQGITTRISFPDPVEEIVCGDLYDPATGKGAFVAQRSGNDVFLKPIQPRGMSNLFVKTGNGGKQVYNFDLMIVSSAQAHRVVNVAPESLSEITGMKKVADAAPPQPESDGGRALSADQDEQSARAQADGIINDARRRAEETVGEGRRQADEILRDARQQAGRIVAEAEQRLIDAERLAAKRAEEETERRFIQALMLGLRETRVSKPHTVTKRIIITLDPSIITINDKSYLRYTIRNGGDKEFAYSAILLESGSGADRRPVPAEVVRNKVENKLEPGESMTGILIFDQKLVGPEDKLVLSVRNADNSEVASINIQ